MQEEKTRKFWDAVHQQDDNKEWILPVSDELLRCIVSHFPPKAVTRVLEIGCGTSSLALNLCDFCDRASKETNSERPIVVAPPAPAHIEVTATDVSPICIEQQMTRFGNQSFQWENASLQYRVFDITEPHSHMVGSFDAIVDKGCIDTLLFRSKKADQWLEKVLCNLHSWLNPNGGVYCIITPRIKLKAVREFEGFTVRRVELPACNFGHGSLEPRSGVGHRESSEKFYLYACTYRKMNFSGVSDELPRDAHPIATCCHICGLSFDHFCRSNKKNRTVDYVRRQWLGHQVHCKPYTI